jgi:general secretion pathway protein G
MSKMKINNKGFTLIELMVVLVILGILAAVVAPKLLERPDQARVIAAKQDIASLNQALKLYRLDNANFPTSDQGLNALVEKPTTGPIPSGYPPGGYIDRLPLDPWGNPYQYIYPGKKSAFDLFSFGSDGQLGGIDTASDVGNWLL